MVLSTATKDHEEKIALGMKPLKELPDMDPSFEKAVRAYGHTLRTLEDQVKGAHGYKSHKAEKGEPLTGNICFIASLFLIREVEC